MSNLLRHKSIHEGAERLPLSYGVITKKQRCPLTKEQRGDEMNKDILRQAGLGKQVDLVDKGKCPICERTIVMSTFRDKLSVKEFNISGMCQACQDDMFEDGEGSRLPLHKCGQVSLPTKGEVT